MTYGQVPRDNSNRCRVLRNAAVLNLFWLLDNYVLDCRQHEGSDFWALFKLLLIEVDAMILPQELVNKPVADDKLIVFWSFFFI